MLGRLEVVNACYGDIENAGRYAEQKGDVVTQVTKLAGMAGSASRCKSGGQNDVINPAKRVNGTIVSFSARGLTVGPGPGGFLFTG